MPEYNPAQVSVSMGGIPLSGFGDGTFISIEKDSDLTTDKVGTDGEVTTSKVLDKRYTATITIMQSSPSNAIMSGFMQLREKGINAAGVVPFFVEDGISGERFGGQRAHILKPPTVVYANEVEGREWTIRIVDGEYFHAGNIV